MDKRAELKREYKNTHQPMGVYLIRNLATGKVLVGSSVNLPAARNRFIDMGSHGNAELQEDYKKYGANNFSFEVVETLDPVDDPNHDYVGELKVLEDMILDKLQPYGEKGYNTAKK
ncbi:GIY-YIG nuclease family protein [bacterium]|nr:GIY-YIG nuclease family protein [bacterium]